MQDNDTTPTQLNLPFIDGNSIPYGYCKCGCGERTPLARQTMTDRGYREGQPLRYVHGHNRRGEILNPPTSAGKLCSRCLTVKPVSKFGRKSSNNDGLNLWCKSCAAEYYRNYYKQNSAKHYTRTVRWRDQNPDAIRAIKRRRRAKEAGGAGPFTSAEWQELLDRYSHKCLCCGATERLTADHVVPLSRGGTHTIDNIQPLCHVCNCRKNTRTIDYRPRPLLDEQPSKPHEPR